MTIISIIIAGIAALSSLGMFLIVKGNDIKHLTDKVAEMNGEIKRLNQALTDCQRFHRVGE
jgi:hypothetical protein